MRARVKIRCWLFWLQLQTQRGTIPQPNVKLTSYWRVPSVGRWIVCSFPGGRAGSWTGRSPADSISKKARINDTETLTFHTDQQLARWWVRMCLKRCVYCVARIAISLQIVSMDMVLEEEDRYATRIGEQTQFTCVCCVTIIFSANGVKWNELLIHETRWMIAEKLALAGAPSRRLTTARADCEQKCNR